MTQEKKDILNAYAQLKTDAKALDKKIDDLAPKVLEIMEEAELEEIELADYGKLTINSRRTWLYPQEVKDKEKEFKEAKSLSERIGTATSLENRFVKFTGLVEDEN